MVMLHTKHQGSGPKGFRQEDFILFYFLYTSICITCDPPPPKAYSNKLRSPLGNATCQNIKALGLVVSDKKIALCYLDSKIIKG